MIKDNFGAGPCILPKSVFEQASKAVLELDDMGLSILEISHRSPTFVDIMEETRSTVLDLMDLKGRGYQALFLQGGASLQFLMAAINRLQNKAAYLNTGRFSSKVIAEAKLFGKVIEVASSKDKNISYKTKGYYITNAGDFID